MRIALTLLEQVWEDKEANITLCSELARLFSEHKSDLIIFPEMTLTGFSSNIDCLADDEKTSDLINEFSELCIKIYLGTE